MVNDKEIQDIKRRAGLTEQGPNPDTLQSNALMVAYRELVDGLHDMVKSRRLKQGDIPDDFQWLMNQIEVIEQLDPSYKR